MGNLRVVSFNCRSVKSSMVAIHSLCDKNDIVFLQETWLSQVDLPLLNNIHPHFIGVGVSGFDINSSILVGRPYGGIAVLYKKNSQSNVSVEIVSQRIMLITLSTDKGCIKLMNVYLPTDYRDLESYENFCSVISELKCEVDKCLNITHMVGIMGDFNANSLKGGSRCFQEVQEFCSEYNFVMSDIDRLRDKENTYTYLSEAHNSVSWLDHIAASQSLHHLIKEINIGYDVMTSDHFPLNACVCAALSNRSEVGDFKHETDLHWKLDWAKASGRDLEQYNKSISDRLHASLYLFLPIVNGCIKDCASDWHTTYIDMIYELIVVALSDASSEHIPKAGAGRGSSKRVVPGWNDAVKGAHEMARLAFLAWRREGSPQEGLHAENMRLTRLQFKYAIRRCRKNREEHKANAFAKTLNDKDSREFWKEINKSLDMRTPLLTSFDDIIGCENIAEHWKNHFQAIFQDRTCASDLNFFESLNRVDDNVPSITANELKNALMNLKSGKAPGLDGVSCDHLIALNIENLTFVGVFFNAILNHAHFPTSLIETSLVPLIKDKSKKLDDLSNYRAIALSNGLSKLYETIILSRLNVFLHTDDAQFGFKPAHSTTQATFVLKEVVSYYNRNGSPVYCCFLDASKAFDRVCHQKLFEILIKRGVPQTYISLLWTWYRTQTMCVRWGECFSGRFNILNGVKQGGNISPLLFSVYIDDLLQEIRQSGIGCHVGLAATNVIAYADDIVLLSPTRRGLQLLVDLSVKFAIERDIKFNPQKSVSMLISSVNSFLVKGASEPCCISLDGKDLEWVRTFKYLGHIISCNLDDTPDILRVKRFLYYQANKLKSRIGYANRNVLAVLFMTFCSQIYGVELWTYTNNRRAWREVRVAYHSCLKRLLKIPISYHNHTVCSAYGVYTFDILLAKKKIMLFKLLSKSANTIIHALKQSDVFRTGPFAKEHLELRRKYEILDCDLDSCSSVGLKRICQRYIRLVAERQVVS